MKIPVMLKDGTEKTVESGELQRLMAAQQILFFKRRKGWVVVGRDNVRGSGGHYPGDERRGRSLA